MDDLEKILNDLNNDSDGVKDFYRINRSMDCNLNVIRPTSLAMIAKFMFSKCLVRVPSRGIEPSCSDEALTLQCGRWSEVVDVEDLMSHLYADDEINSNLYNRTRARINDLVRLGTFYRFTVKVGYESFSIYTYNRHVQLNGVYWPQHWRDEDKEFSPPVVPMVLAILSKNSSYKNAVARMYSTLWPKFKDRVGWRTDYQAQAIIKDFFCRNFLNQMISQMAPSVRAKFKTFEESGLSHNEFVKYVHATAKSLPDFEGIEFTAEFALGLRLPKSCTDVLHKTVNKVAKKHSVSNPRTLTVSDTKNIGRETAKIAVESGDCETAKNAPTVGGETAKNARLFDDETGLNNMNTNELVIEGTVPCRGVLVRGHVQDVITNEESVEMTEQENEESLGQQALSTDASTCQPEVYNQGMNEVAQKDLALTEEQQKTLAFSSRDFNLIPDRPEREKPKAKKSEAKQEMDEYTQMGGDFNRKKKSEEASAKSKNPLESVHGFVKAFKSAVSEVVPGAKFSAGPFEAREYIEAQALLDILKLKGAFDETVLRGWMLHTANLNLKNKGYFSVSMMRKTWDSWVPHIPSPDFLVRKNAQKKAPAAPKKNVIIESLGQIFSAGVTPAATFRACQGWGVTITAFYLGSVGKPAEQTIRACLEGRPMVEIKSIFSVTVRFEGAGMETSVWRTQFADLLGKVGRLDELKVSDFDKSKVGDFIAKIKKGDSK